MPSPEFYEGVGGTGDNELIASLKRLGIEIPGSTDAGQSGQFTGMQRWLGGTADNGSQINGYLPTAVGVGTGLLNGYLGMKQYGLAKDQFRQNRKEFGLNYDAQQQSVNTQLEDRQRARVRGNPGAYESVSSYMDRNRVKDR